MATQVPYTGTQDVSPQLEPLQQAHVDTPTAAFGGAVAQAVGHLGEAAEGAGKEIFARGLAFQEMDEQVKADQASADTMDAQTQRYMEYDKLKGQERIDAYPQYIKDLEQIRQQGSQSLSSPYAKQKYLDDSRRQQSQMVWHGAMLARQGQDEATKASAEAGMNARVQRYATLDPGSPNDTHDFDLAAQGIREAAAAGEHNSSGLEPGTPESDAKIAPVVSAKVAQMIQQKINGPNPALAQPLIDHAVKEKLLLPDAADILSQKADNAVHFRLARKIGTENAAGSTHEDPAVVEARIRAAAEKAAPGDKITSDNAVLFGNQRQGLEESAETNANRFTLHTLIGGIDGTSTNGKVPVSLDEASQDPVWKERFDASPDEVKQSVIKQITRNQATDGWIPNTAGNAEFAQLHATLVDPRSSAKEIDTALNTNLMDTSMTIEQRKQIGLLQMGIIKAQSNEGNINSALRSPAVQLAIQNAGLTKGTQEYVDFVSAFTKTTEQFAEGKHGRLKDEDYGKIANQMLMHQAGSWNPLNWNAGGGAMYKDPFAANPGLKAQALKMFKDAKGRDPSEDELNSMSGMMYQKYFTTLGETSRPGTKNTNRVQPKGKSSE